MSNRLAAQRRMWLLVKAKEKELKDERDKFEADIKIEDGKLSERKNAISRSKCTSVSQ